MSSEIYSVGSSKEGTMGLPNTSGLYFWQVVEPGCSRFS